MAGGASSSFSCTPSFFTYDVFLSFRGEDTRIGFTGHLYFALDQGGIFTFFDDREIGKGKKIRPSLVKAIEESRIAIVVLSKNYASSSFCLDELVNIMECVEKKKVRLVIPIFYDVDPSHVRKQRGTFGKALLAHKKKFKAASKTENFNDDMKRLKTWKEALRGVANLSGYHISKHGRVQECRLIEEIVYQVSRGIRRVALHFVYHPVGLDGRDDNVIRALYDNGGMDKTTLIKAAYDLIGNRLEDFSFEGICVFEKIIENSNNQRGLKHPQKIIWRLEYQGEAIDIGVKEIIDLKHKKFSRRYLNELLSESERNHRVFRFSMKGRIPEIGMHAVRHESLDSLLMKGYSANSTAQIEMSSTTTNVQENEWNHVECHFYPIHRPKRWKTKRWKTEVPKRWKIEVHVINHKSSVEDDIQFSDQEDHPPAENSLKDCVSNSVAQNGISSTTNNVQEYDQAVLYHPKKVPGESSRAAGFAKTQNTEAQRSILSSGKISGQELHLNTMLPTTIDESVRGHLEPSDDDAEMEAFYASLDADSYVLSHSHDHSARSVTSEKAKEALKILQDFIIKDPSFLVDPKQYTTFKSSLDYLSNLSASDDGFSGEMRALISEASRMFTHSSGDYIEASMKIESTSSELLKANELEAGMEDNNNQFKKIVALEKELLQKLVYLEESKKELEKQIYAIEASISDSQSEQSMIREKKRDIFKEGKTLKAQISEFRGKVTHLQREQDVARETQAKITAEWLELGEKFQKVVVE